MATFDAETLIEEYASGTISRRDFVVRALVLGMSSGAVAVALMGATPASVTAQSEVIYPEGYVGPRASAKEPLSAETVTLRVAVPTDEMVDDWSDNAFTAWFEARTNVHVEWMALGGTPEDIQTKANAMIAGGELPDVFMSANFTPAQQFLYGAQGVFVPLNDLIEEHGVEIERIFEEYSTTRDLITATDGNIYSMPNVNDCYHCNGSNKLWINKTWLDALGLGIPQTTEEFYQALKAFKEQDPNGNGEADEVPLMSAIDSWVGAASANNGVSNGSLDNFFMGSFLYNPGEPWLVLNGEGQVDVTFNQPGWREGLRFLNRLHGEGLLAAESFSQTREQLIRAGDNPDAPILGAVPAGWWGVFLTVDQAEQGRWQDFVAVPPLAGPDGTRIAPWNHYAGVTSGQFVVTSACDHPDIAVRWADTMYELEATLRSVHGVLDEDVRWAEEGEIGINGEQGVWRALVTWASEAMRNRFWNQVGVQYRTSDFRLGEVVDPATPTFEKPLYEETRANYFPYIQDQSLQLPPLFLTEKQASVAGELATTINSHVKLMFAQFILGDADVNDDGAWEEYVNTFEQMGLAQYLQIHQEAYEAKYGG